MRIAQDRRCGIFDGMNRELIDAIERFLRAEIGSEDLRLWGRELVLRIRAQNPNERYTTKSLDYLASESPMAQLESCFPDADPRVLGRVWAKAISRLFKRSWNRSENPSEMVGVLNADPRISFTSAYNRYISDNEWTEIFSLFDSSDEDTQAVIETAAYNINMGDLSGIDDLAVLAAKIDDSDYRGAQLLSKGREKLRNVRKSWADEIRDRLLRPDPMDIFVAR
jgi:hypothetical protein